MREDAETFVITPFGAAARASRPMTLTLDRHNHMT